MPQKHPLPLAQEFSEASLVSTQASRSSDLITKSGAIRINHALPHVMVSPAEPRPIPVMVSPAEPCPTPIGSHIIYYSIRIPPIRRVHHRQRSVVLFKIVVTFL